MSIIKVENLCKSFGSLEVLKNISINIESGERIAIIGPSGGGKSVFLRSLNLLETPDSGKIFIDGVEITAKNAKINEIRKNIGMVYQGFHLFEHMNVIDNITLAPRKLKKIPRKEAEEQAIELLRMVGLESKKYEMPNVLSGGQKQRIAIARCLAMNPKIMLFDEPTSALDPTMVGEVLATIRMLEKRNLTLLIVTHEMNFARDVATKILFFEDHGIYESGTPKQIFDTPSKQKTNTFIRKLKYFSEEITSPNFDIMKIRGGIIAFVEKYGISHKTSYHLQLCSEELIYEMLKNCFPTMENVNMNLSIEYSELEKAIILSFNCGGKEYHLFDAIEDEEHIGVTIIRNASKKYEYCFQDHRNKITINF